MFDQLINQVPAGLHSIPSNFAHLVAKVLIAISEANVRNAPGTSSTVLLTAKKGDIVGTTTGRVYKFDNGTTVWIEVKTPLNKLAWVSAKVVSVQQTDDLKDQAKKLIDTIIETDRATYNNIVVANALLVRAEKSGKNITAEKSSLYALTGSWQKRQKEIAEASWLKVTYNSITSGLKSFAQKIAGMVGLGEPVTVTILGVTIAIKYIVAASIVMGAAITLAVIRYLQTNNNQAAKEFDASKKIIADILNKLSESDKNALTDEINKQLNEAYKDGRKSQFWDLTGSAVKNMALIGLGIILVTNVLPKVFGSTKRKYNG